MDIERSSNLKEIFSQAFFKCQAHPISFSAGNVQYAQGKSIVETNIYGPFEGRARNLDFEGITIHMPQKKRKFILLDINVQFKIDGWVAEGEKCYLEKALISILKNVIKDKKYPGSVLRIKVYVKSNKGNIVSTIINSVMLSILMNGIQCQTTVWAYDFCLSPTKSIHFYPDSLMSHQVSTEVIDLFSNQLIYADIRGDFSLNSLKNVHEEFDSHAKQQIIAMIKYFYSKIK